MSYVRSRSTLGRVEFLNFPEGFQFSDGRLLLYNHPSNAFISATSYRRDDMVTVFSEWHDRLGSIAPVRQVPNLRLWVQVCHGDNVVNQERGIRADHRKYRERFPFLEIEEQTTPRYLYDLLVTCFRAGRAVLSSPRRITRLLPKRGHA